MITFTTSEIEALVDLNKNLITSQIQQISSTNPSNSDCLTNIQTLLTRLQTVLSITTGS